MERSKVGTKERSSNRRSSLPNQNTILMNIIGIMLHYMVMLQNMVLCYKIWHHVTK